MKNRHDDGFKDKALTEAIDKQIAEGEARLARPTAALITTGIMGSLEIGVGLLAEYTVFTATGSEILGSIAFAVGLIIILLAHSELFTEGFLVPVAAVVAGAMPVSRLLRFWAGTFIGNVVGAALIMWLLVIGYPDMHGYLIDKSTHYAQMSMSPETLVRAAFGGMILTLVTRMHQFTDNATARIIASLIGGFLLSATGIIHSILDTLFIFGGIFAGAVTINFGSWLAFVWWVALANLIGGLALVTSFRFVQAKDIVKDRADSNDSSD